MRLRREGRGDIHTLMNTVALDWLPATDHHHLLAEPVRTALRQWPGAQKVEVAEIDPALADTAALVAATDVSLASSANCLVVRARRGGTERLAAALVLATTKADINNVVRKTLEARKCSFLAMDAAVDATGMEYGGITPLGLPEEWPVLVDSRVVTTDQIVIGSGLRRSKIRMPGEAARGLPGARVIEGLALEA